MKNTVTSENSETTIHQWVSTQMEDEDQTINQKTPNEVPHLFLAISEDGFPLFHWRIKQTKKFDGHLTHQIKQIILPLLDINENIITKKQAINDISLILKKEEDIFFCYLFKGNCRSAKNRMNKILEKIKSHKKVWKGILSNARHNTTMRRWEIAFLKTVTEKLLVG